MTFENAKKQLAVSQEQLGKPKFPREDASENTKRLFGHRLLGPCVSVAAFAVFIAVCSVCAAFAAVCAAVFLVCGESFLYICFLQVFFLIINFLITVGPDRFLAPVFDQTVLCPNLCEPSLTPKYLGQ